ncbi:MAG: alpha-mannosidase [Anaerolineales bacterium]
MKTLHVISHTHWDREWYLTFQQFRLKLVHLIDKVLDLFDQDPDFKHFMLDGQTIVLDDYLQMRPEKEEILKRHIQAGRILIGPWHILPDMFLVSPEAHIRNLLQGTRTAREFGPKMPVGYIPDPFGHPGQIPQILQGFGLEAAALWRGLSDCPTELWWESPDGSKVLLANLRDSYSNGANLPVSNAVAFTEQIAIAGDSLAAHSAGDDYLIMLGTDHMEPSPHTARAIAHATVNLPDTDIVHSTLPDYMQRIRTQIENLERSIPTIQGELRACDRSHLLPGVLSTRMWIKQRNQASQTLLEKWVEPFSVFAERFIADKSAQTEWADRTPDAIASKRVRNVAPIIRQAWRLVMENHPHDSICGCSIDQVHDEMKPRFDQADQIGEEITLQALQALSKAVDTQSKDAYSAIVLFNPHGHPHRSLVEVELNMPEEVAAFEIVNADGTVISHEFLGAGNEQIANVLLPKDSLRDTIGAIHEGRVAGSALLRVRISRQGPTVIIDATLDDQSQPNILEWQQAEHEIARHETDPSVTHFHVIAHTPRASKIRFVSPDVPPLGWQTVWVRALEVPAAAPGAKVSPQLKPLLPLALRFAQSEFGGRILAKSAAGKKGKPPFVIENQYFRIEASQTDGTLTVFDKNTKTVFSGLNRFVDGGDAGDEYNYSPPTKDSFYKPTIASLKAFRHRLIPSLEIEYALKIPAQLSSDRNSRSNMTVTIPIRSRVSLVPGVARIDIRTEIDNLAKDHRLRVHFPAPFTAQEADYDGHFEIVRRPIGVPEKGEDWIEAPRPEVPQRAFTDISHGEIGLMIANRGLPEVEVIKVDENTGTEIALTLLRCVGWLSRDDLPVRQGHAGPPSETPGGQVLGKWCYDYAIIPHHGTWREAYRQAFAYETPLRAVETGLHEGEIPVWGSFVFHSPAEFVITAIKETENGTGWIVRGYNIASETIELDLKPLRKFAKAMLVNLAEEEITPLSVTEDGSVSLSVSGHKVVSVLFVT